MLQGVGPLVYATWILPEALQKQLGEAWKLANSSGISLRLTGLLDRDVLRSTKFNYDGVNGVLRVVFY